MPTLIYHITHLRNLTSILAHNELCCDRLVGERGLAPIEIGYRDLKGRRAARTVPIPPGGTLDDYVPFYYAPRSPMLFVISKGGVPGYNDGQRSVVHLVADAEQVAEQRLPFVFTDGHAYMQLSTFYSDLTHLNRIDWLLMRERIWRDTPEDGDRVRRRNAEFLVHNTFPWPLVQGIGVIDEQVAELVQAVIAGSNHQPRVVVRPGWYYL
jgi:hypothetical protein